MNEEDHLTLALEVLMCSKPSDVQKLIDKYEKIEDFPKESLERLKELVKIRPWY